MLVKQVAGVAIVSVGLALSGIGSTCNAEGESKSVQVEIPEWLLTTKIYGDVRLRQQWDKTTGRESRSRQRIRFRINGQNKIGEKMKIGYGLATGGTDPRSTNQTLDNNFETPDIRLNNAYVEFDPIEDLSIWGGKYTGVKHIMWRPTDLLWDSDITPDGGGIKYKKGQFFVNAGWLIVDENKNGSDPGIGYGQIGVEIPLADNFNFKVAGVWYIPGSMQGAVMEHGSGSNTTNSEGGLFYDFNVIQGSFEISAKDMIGLDKVAVMSDIVVNTDPSDDNLAWDAGIKLKKSRVSFKYNYRYLEKDSFVDAYPDSDAFDGETGVKGHEAEVKFAIYEHTSLNFDAYHMTQIDGTKDNDVAQLDLVVKF